MARLPINQRVPNDFYDIDYFKLGKTSNYKPYGPGEWLDWITGMLHEYVQPASVLDVGCAYGYIVKKLTEDGVPAWGFDVSDYAYAYRVTPRTWRGTVEDPGAWRNDVDLVLAMAVVEHLTEDQNRALLQNAAQRGQRLLILAGSEHEGPMPEGDHDWSHIGFLTHKWWLDETAKIGFFPDDHVAEQLNQDERSVKMEWSPRFLFFTKQKPEKKAAAAAKTE